MKPSKHLSQVIDLLFDACAANNDKVVLTEILSEHVLEELIRVHNDMLCLEEAVVPQAIRQMANPVGENVVDLNHFKTLKRKGNAK